MIAECDCPRACGNDDPGASCCIAPPPPDMRLSDPDCEAVLVPAAIVNGESRFERPPATRLNPDDVTVGVGLAGDAVRPSASAAAAPTVLPILVPGPASPASTSSEGSSS